MKIVILGGSGYLASCLCFYLKKKKQDNFRDTRYKEDQLQI